MTLFRTVEPAVEPVTLSEVKTHLRIDGTTEDDLLGGLIRAARQDVERSAGLALIDQSWRLVLDRWPSNGTMTLRVHPVREVLSITLYGSEGEALLLAPQSYQVDTLSRPARIHAEVAPPALRAMNGVEIDFSAGFGESGPDVPDLLKRAILLLVAHWYEFRSGFGPADQPVSYPEGYERMIASHRAGRL